jgi:PTS system N-acetylglucosamine-specific IIB component
MGVLGHGNPPGHHHLKEGHPMGKAEDIIAGLGGAENIDEIEACATRLRTVVNDPSLVNEKALKAAGAFGVLSSGTVIQVIVGGEADGLSMDINDIID